MKMGHQKFLLKEWRSKETRLLLMALIIAISMLSMLSFYSERIYKTLDNNAAEFLGGDLVISSPSPIPADWTAKAKELECTETETIIFPSMASANTGLHLANIKAITAPYPLYGNLQIADNTNQKGFKTKAIPAPGTVWIDKQFLKLLNIKLQDNIQIGYAKLTATHLITYEPDANPFGFTIAPRIIMNSTDLPQTKLIQPGSRIEYRWYIAGNAHAIQQLKSWLRPLLQKNQKLTTIRQDSAELAKTLRKADAFLHIAAVICLLLAGIAIAMTTRYFIQRQTSSVALLRCFGLVYRDIFKIFSLYFLLLAIISSIIGCSIGYFAQLGLTKIISQWLKITLLPTSLWPLLPSVSFGFIILFGFALPALRNLKQIPASWILRKQAITISHYSLLLYFTAGISLIAILSWYIRDLALIALVLSGLGITAAGLYGAAWLLINALKPLRKSVGTSWRYGLASLARRANNSIVQIVTFGFIFMVILLQMMVRTDLINSWETQIPEDAPNIFAINIQPFEVTQFNNALQKFNLDAHHLYPMVRGRLTTLNSKPIKQVVPIDARNNNALNRELNLTWTDTLPETNKVTAGQWWQQSDQGKPYISMEKELADKLEIKLGDRLGFQIGDQFFEATLYNLRTVEWYSFQPNFFMLFPSKVIEHFPATYITSFLVTDANRLALAKLNQQFPSVTFVDVGALLNQIRHIIHQVTLASNYILIFIMIAGIIVLNASLLTSHDERVYESAILRSLGSTKQQLYAGLLTEFITIGFIAGLLAVAGAVLTATILATTIFKILPHFNMILCLAAPFAASIIISSIGLFNTYRIVYTSPLKVIRGI